MSIPLNKAQQEDILILNHYSNILSNIQKETDLNKLINVFLEKMSKTEIKDINPLIISALCNNICAKIFLMTNSRAIDEPISNLLEFMFEQDIMPAVYAAPMKLKLKQRSENLLNFESLKSESVPDEKASTDLMDQINQNLNHLLNFNNNEKINKNYGYSLIGLNGDFIWCDSISQKLFEFKEKKNLNKNLFDMMIPFSKQLLNKKFGPELFDEKCDFGSSLVFSYVCYSKNSMNKFYKCIKSLVKTEEEFRERLKKKETDDAIYNQYLKALSSRATLVLLKFTRAELQTMMEDRKYGIKTKSSFFHGIANKVIEKSSKKRDSSKLSSAKKINLANQLKSAVEDKSELICKEAILLETRLSYNTPKFDYTILQNDPRIKFFEQKIVKRISK